MKTAYIFKQYTWLVDTVRKAGHITFRRLSELWEDTEMSGGVSLSRTSFNRYRDGVLDMFGIVIDCQRRGGNTYYILNEYELEKESVQNWMYSTISISQLLNERKRLFSRILMECVPSAERYLKTLLHTMYDGCKLDMIYQRYEAEAAKEYKAASPYCLKLHNRRWYVLMEVEDGKLKLFSLDRIKGLDVLPERFKVPKDFNAAEFFRECYGVVVGDGTPATHIRLRAFGRERYAMQDLPVHHSQQLVTQGPDYCDFEVYLRPTSDFKAYIASKGQWLVVLSPQSLAQDVMAIHQEALDKYKSMMEGSFGAP